MNKSSVGVEAQSTQIPGNSEQLQLETKQSFSCPEPFSLQFYQQENPAKIKKKKKNTFLRSNDTLVAITTLGAIWLL